MSTSLTSQLTQSLRDALLNGDFLPGEHLRLNHLSKQFEVSLSPLREALSRLAAEGLLVAHDQRGYQVAPVSARNHQEITTLRLMLEPYALRKSIELGDESWEVALLAANHRLQQVEHRHEGGPDGDAHPEWEARHRHYHMTLISAGDMPVLTHFCESLLTFSDRYRRLFIKHGGLDRNISGEHDAILKATLNRDADQACVLLSQHIERTAHNIQQALLNKSLQAEEVE